MISLALKRKGVELGENVRFAGMPLVQVLFESAQVRIGDGASIISRSGRTALGLNHATNLRVIAPGARISIGKNVGISGGTIVAACSISIGDDSILGANVTIVDTDFHPLDPLNRRGAALPAAASTDAVSLGRNVFVGMSAILLKGTTVGDDSVIGAGAVVKGEFPRGSVIAGNPARVVRSTIDALPAKSMNAVEPS